MTAGRRRNPDKIIMEQAAAHRGVCSRAQLMAVGVGSTSIERRVKSGLLKRAARGIYVVTALAGEYTPHEVALAAAPEGALSRLTAARLHGFPVPTSATLHITVPKGADNRAPRVVVHETRHWHAEDVVLLHRLRVTSPARTLIDLAGGLRRPRLRHITQQQLLCGEPSAAELGACLERLDDPRIPGVAMIASLLAELLDDEPFPSSELELRVFTGLTERGITGVHRQFRPPWYDGIRGIVDGADPVGRTIIEADGRRWHSTTQAKRDDDRRDRIATLHGWHVIRIGWLDVVEHPTATFDEVAAIIQTRRTAADAEAA